MCALLFLVCAPPSFVDRGAPTNDGSFFGVYTPVLVLGDCGAPAENFVDRGALTNVRSLFGVHTPVLAFGDCGVPTESDPG